MMGQLPAQQNALFYEFCLEKHIPEFFNSICRFLTFAVIWLSVAYGKQPLRNRFWGSVFSKGDPQFVGLGGNLRPEQTLSFRL
jgi:hypothetical protein